MSYHISGADRQNLIHTQTDGQTDRQTNLHIDGRTDRQTGRQARRHAGRQADKQTNRTEGYDYKMIMAGSAWLYRGAGAYESRTGAGARCSQPHLGDDHPTTPHREVPHARQCHALHDLIALALSCVHLRPSMAHGVKEQERRGGGI